MQLPGQRGAEGIKQQSELSLAEDLKELRAELRRHHELTDTEGHEEHPVGEPLKLKSPFWDIEIDTTTGVTHLVIDAAPDWMALACSVCPQCCQGCRFACNSTGFSATVMS